MKETNHTSSSLSVHAVTVSSTFERKLIQEIFQTVTNLITPRALFSPVFLQRCSVIHESGSDNSFQSCGHSKFSKMAGGRSWIWYNRKQVHSIRRPRKPYPRTKREVDRKTRCRDMAVQSFPKCEVGRSVVGAQCHIVLIHSSSLGQERSARGVKIITNQKTCSGLVYRSPITTPL